MIKTVCRIRDKTGFGFKVSVRFLCCPCFRSNAFCAVRFCSCLCYLRILRVLKILMILKILRILRIFRILRVTPNITTAYPDLPPLP